eukprot:TRINITY_DN27574_c0_g1_i7.p1 TRINITY_DN27574_c0_g1~~TRINITY_DN27574_c0_g1_i7.p1  ORF type:complete len:132 (+),score=28.02 TRINITY_DN27574_c0_g1_i7:36-398(+)
MDTVNTISNKFSEQIGQRYEVLQNNLKAALEERDFVFSKYNSLSTKHMELQNKFLSLAQATNGSASASEFSDVDCNERIAWADNVPVDSPGDTIAIDDPDPEFGTLSKKNKNKKMKNRFT